MWLAFTGYMARVEIFVDGQLAGVEFLNFNTDVLWEKTLICFLWIWIGNSFTSKILGYLISANECNNIDDVSAKLLMLIISALKMLRCLGCIQLSNSQCRNPKSAGIHLTGTLMHGVSHNIVASILLNIEWWGTCRQLMNVCQLQRCPYDHLGLLSLPFEERAQPGCLTVWGCTVSIWKTLPAT